MKKIFKLFRNPKFVKIAGGVLIFIVVLAGAIFVLKTQGRVNIENSLVSAPITTLSPTTPGKIKSIEVAEGQKVKKGDALAEVGTEIIRALADGVVILTNKQVGALVSPQTPVIQVINTNDMRIDGTIDENKGLNQIKVGQVVSFTVDALPGQTFWGYVDEISQSAKQTQISFSISSERPTQQFDVFARFNANTYPQIKNGMSAKMIVYTNTF